MRRRASSQLKGDGASAKCDDGACRQAEALTLVPGWMEMSKCRRHGSLAVWYRRADGPDHTRWVEAPDEDLIG
jgi:hypothetical protein